MSHKCVCQIIGELKYYYIILYCRVSSRLYYFAECQTVFITRYSLRKNGLALTVLLPLRNLLGHFLLLEWATMGEYVLVTRRTKIASHF